MRKIIGAMCAVVALAGMGAGAGTAAADDPGARFSTTSYGTGPGGGTLGSCEVGPKSGVPGQYGAWGNYIDGCTVRLKCPAGTTVTTCEASSESRIGLSTYNGQNVSLNSRLRVFSSSGYNFWFRDQSCFNTNWCRNEDMVYVRPGESASVQCNGVRQTSQNNTGNVRCQLFLRYS
jgi:hypothetical protein